MHQLQKLKLENISIQIETWGDIHSAPPLVLVHGFTGSKLDWVDQVAALAELGPVITLDQRGHGDSSNTGKEEDYSLEILVNDLKQVFKQLELNKVHLLGHSLGGMVTMRFALKNPKLLQSLILMDTSPHGIKDFADLSKIIPIVKNKGMAVLADNAQKTSEQRTDRPSSVIANIEALGSDEYFSRISRKLKQMDPAAFAALGAELAQQTGVLEQLKQIDVATTVIVGEQDQPFIEASQAMIKAIAGAKLNIISQAAHSPQMENPQQWFDCIKEHCLACA